MTEKAGKAEGVTEYDSEFEELCHQLDRIKMATEHMLTHVEGIVQPNPSTTHTHVYLMPCHLYQLGCSLCVVRAKIVDSK